MLLIEALRSTSNDDAPAGLLRGLPDALLAVAMRQMHGDPSRSWTVEQLAKKAALSPSAYFDRFTLTGEVTVPAWRSKPSWCLVATNDDKMIPPPARRQMSLRTGSTVAEVAGSHAVSVSQPQAVASLIEKAAASLSK